MIRLALFQPEIPQNTGTLMRFAACLGFSLDIIEPCGFLWDDKKLHRSSLDYLDLASVTRHSSWDRFVQARTVGRFVLVDVDGSVPYLDFSFSQGDCLILGQESCGIPSYVRDSCPHSVRIPMVAQRRSINMALSGAIVMAEGLRQTKGFPE